MEAITKAEIIMEFVQRNADQQIFDEFFAYNDLGIPLSVAIKAGLCELTPTGGVVLDETYSGLLSQLEIDDIEKEYNNLDEILEDSNIDEEE